MIIKRPTANDVPRMSEIWQAAFRETAEDTAPFFAIAFSPERSSIAVENGVILGALYWFDCLWSDKKLAYIYAVGTDPNHWGKGVCRALMNGTHSHLASCGYRGAVLEPASKDLEAMYQKMGYRVCCPVLHYKAPGQDALGTMDFSDYMAARETLLPPDAVLHTKLAFRYMEGSQGEFFRFPEGIGCGFRKDGILHLQERLPVGLPADHTHTAMYLPLDGTSELPSYFALDLA